jgi:hypothetical protein
MDNSQILLGSITRLLKSAPVPVLIVLLFGVASFLTFGPEGSGIGGSSKMLELANWTGPLLWTSVQSAFL